MSDQEFYCEGCGNLISDIVCPVCGFDNSFEAEPETEDIELLSCETASDFEIWEV